MKKIKLGNSGLEVGEVSLGCMRMSSLSKDDARHVIENAMEHGIELFDHADIYGGGESESVFADAIGMNPSVREKMILQTKCAIRKGFYDYSKEHILSSVEGSLKRLKTDYIDIFLLHRPDALMEPEEVAEAFNELKESGKVQHFGVSNHNSMQIELLKRSLDQDLIINQMQFSLMHTPMIDAGINVNMQNEGAVMREGGILEYSRLNNMTIQAWSPFQYGMIEGPFVGNEDYPEVNAKLQELAEKYSVTDSAIAITWILRHPAKIQPVVGSMNPQRMADIAKASHIELTREEWYELYRTAGNNLP
ncbi:aldo/keto reductase family oxidoreductase [Bacillus sp. Marseille-Q3570]|uniref:aldo/keto reductase n=1 Tax=Bacillus sp. Marseille-Q3570 TaxID=2963522 RepID=UPI0021B72310|nr:aldo/keto reductase [Bacillus sp. Marseille-Q3570]